MLLDPERPEDNEQQQFINDMKDHQSLLKSYLTMEQQFSVISQNKIIDKMSPEQLKEYAKSLVVQNYAIRHMAATAFATGKPVT